jgi:hypothetical protein
MDPRYPTGPFTFDSDVTPQKRAAWISAIGSFPTELTETLKTIGPDKLDQRYRDGGWTARQVVHHVADSHMNAYIRFKLALTETNPPLKPYDETVWTEHVDARTEDPSVSVGILQGLHRRLHAVLQSLAPEDFARTGVHADHGPVTVDWLLQMYAWHGRHHIGHLKIVATR